MKKRALFLLLTFTLVLFFASKISLVPAEGYANYPQGTFAHNCSDTDGGLNFYVKGMTQGDQSSTVIDSCAGSVLSEGYCGSFGLVFQDQYTCPYGCANGVCLNNSSPVPAESSLCSSQKASLSRGDAVSGILSDEVGNYTMIDTCGGSLINSDYMTKYFCYGSYIAGKLLQCPNGCFNGTCVPPGTGIPMSASFFCHDNNNGSVRYGYGSLNTSLSPTECVHITGHYNTTPLPDEIVYYYCDNLSVAGIITLCEGSGKCANGFCIDGIIRPSKCTNPNYDGCSVVYPRLDTNYTTAKNVSAINKVVYCIPSWSCGDWNPENCSSGQNQTRTCFDTAECSSENLTADVRACNSETDITQINEDNNNLSCTSGCSYQNSCVPIGYRTRNQYCNIDNHLVDQIIGGSCNNNFECQSNLCASSDCVTPGFLQQVINFFKHLFGIQ